MNFKLYYLLLILFVFTNCKREISATIKLKIELENKYRQTLDRESAHESLKARDTLWGRAKEYKKKKFENIRKGFGG